jgi:hypothetical protein
LGEVLEVVNGATKDSGTLASNYHHSDKESWGELLEPLCNTGFEITATYPINSDLHKFIGGEAVSFDIVIVARPINERSPTSWDSLRRQIVRTAKETCEILEENRDLSGGDIGVIEMGKCFQEYSKHHGEIRGSEAGMTAKRVVEEIYGIIQGGDEGERDIFVDLLDMDRPTYNDLNKLLRRSNASEESMRETRLFRMENNDLVLGTWDDEQRQAYVQQRVNETGADGGDLTDLDKAQFLRYRYEHDRSTAEYVDRWESDDLRDLCEGLAEATRDETYLKVLGLDASLGDFFEE